MGEAVGDDEAPKMNARSGDESGEGLVGVVGGVARMSPLLMLSERWRRPELPPIFCPEIVGSAEAMNTIGVIGDFFITPSSSSPSRTVAAGDDGEGDCGENLPHTLPIVSRRSEDTANRAQWCACMLNA